MEEGPHRYDLHRKGLSVKCDIFFSICQTEVDDYFPSEKVMFQNFFDQVELADQLGFGVAWVAETHLSCEIQKSSAQAVIPHFKGEIGLNTDILQMAHRIFSKTKKIEVGSAIRNILCNGGPIANAEAIKTFLALHGLDDNETRKLNIGFAAGRFDFSNRPYGIVPRNEWEKKAWAVVKGKAFLEATEIFLRLLRGENISRQDVPIYKLDRADFRKEEEWFAVQEVARGADLTVKPFWNFEKVGVIPNEVRLDLLSLTIGTHDPFAQELANKFLPVGVFNLSITPPDVIEETHRRFTKMYGKRGDGEDSLWRRDLMPRTCLIYIDEDRQKAKSMAERAWTNYWNAMEGTLDPKKVQDAVSNTLAGDPEELVQQIKEKYHPDDRLMLWFDFNNHDNEAVKKSMKLFFEKVQPKLPVSLPVNGVKVDPSEGAAKAAASGKGRSL